jgi:hypothetical protein
MLGCMKLFGRHRHSSGTWSNIGMFIITSRDLEYESRLCRTREVFSTAFYFLILGVASEILILETPWFVQPPLNPS